MRELPIYPRVKLIFKGAFLSDHYDESADNYMYYYLTMHFYNQTSRNVTELLKFPIANVSDHDNMKIVKRSNIIYLQVFEYDFLHTLNASLQLNMLTELDTGFAVNFSYDPSPLDTSVGLMMAAVILMGLYVLIIWELVHRTFAAMIASTLAIGE